MSASDLISDEKLKEIREEHQKCIDSSKKYIKQWNEYVDNEVEESPIKMVHISKKGIESINDMFESTGYNIFDDFYNDAE